MTNKIVYTVIFNIIWHVVVDDMLDIGEIESFRGDVGGH